MFAAVVSIAATAQQEARRPDTAPLSSAKDDVVVMERYTVAGTGMAMDTLKYPGSVSVLLPSDLEQKADIIQSLSQVPGFETGLDNGRSVGQQYTIRGFGYQSEDRVIVEQDGVRRSTSLYSNLTSSFRVDADLLKQVEVVKGASSIMHGGGAIGGVVSMTTKDAADFILPGNKMGATVKLRHETNGVAEGSVGAAVHGKGWIPEILAYVKVGHKGDLTLSEEFTDSTGRTYDTVDNKEDLRTYFLKAAWVPGAGQRFSVSYFRYEDETEVTWQSLFNTEYDTSAGPVKGTLSQDDWVARYTLAPASVNWLDLAAVASYSKSGYDRGYTSVNGAGVSSRIDYDNSDERLGFKLENLFRWETGPVAHRTLVGFDYQHREEGAVNVRNGVLADFGSMPNKYDDHGLYVQEEASMIDGRLVFLLSGRFDSFKRAVPKKSYDYDNDHFSPRTGFSFEFARGLTLLGNYSESFRAPTPHEAFSEGPLNINYYYLPNPNLKPELAREFEFGLSWQCENLLLGGDRVRAKAVYFTGKIEDMIVLAPDYDGPMPPQSNYYASYGNVGKVRRNGVEIEFAYTTRYWGVRASFESLDQKDAQTDAKTPFAFADKIQAGVQLHPFAKELFTFFAGVEHWLPPQQNPKTLVSGTLTYYYVTDDYTQVNAGLSWTPSRTGIAFLDSGMEFRAGVNNLFNAPRLHSSNVTTSTRVGLGTNVFVSVAKRF